MAFCSHCGKQVSEGMTFCPDCGERLGFSERPTKPLDVGCVSPSDNREANHKEPKESQMSEQKERHGCLTAYLICAIIVNSAVALWYVFGGLAVFGIGAILIVAGIFNVVCFIALLKWKKWGFWDWSFQLLLSCA
jgi:DNA-directed RNA polymerase subunit RPC12/RpoP